MAKAKRIILNDNIGTTVEPAIRKKYDTPKIGDIRKTFIVDASLTQKIIDIAYWDRLTVKDALKKAMQDYVDKYEKKNGPVKASAK